MIFQWFNFIVWTCVCVCEGHPLSFVMSAEAKITLKDAWKRMWTWEQLVDRINFVIESQGGVKTCDIETVCENHLYYRHIRWFPVKYGIRAQLNWYFGLVQHGTRALDFFYRNRAGQLIERADLDTAVIEFCQLVAKELYQ